MNIRYQVINFHDSMKCHVPWLLSNFQPWIPKMRLCPVRLVVLVLLNAIWFSSDLWSDFLNLRLSSRPRDGKQESPPPPPPPPPSAPSAPSPPPSPVVVPVPKFCPQELRGKANSSCPGPLTKPMGNRSVALLLRGETFRGDRGQYDRRIEVTPKAAKLQRMAARSQWQFIIEPLELCGFQVEIFFSTYTPESTGVNGSQLLMEMYGHNLVSFAFRNPKQRGKKWNQDTMYRDVVSLFTDHVKKTRKTYDGLVMIRFDLIFKRSLFETPADWSKILYPFHIWQVGSGQPGLGPQRVPDVLHWCPWHLFNCMLPLGFMEHNALYTLRGAKGIGVPNLGFMMPEEFHDSNTAVDRNPLYKQMRPEQEFDVHGGFAILIVSSLDPKETVSQQAAISNIRSHVLQQGRPQPTHFTAIDLFVHTWDDAVCAKKQLKEAWGARDHRVLCGGPDLSRSKLKEELQQVQKQGTNWSTYAFQACPPEGSCASCEKPPVKGLSCPCTKLDEDGGISKMRTEAEKLEKRIQWLSELRRFAISFTQSYRGIQWAKSLNGPYDRCGAAYDQILVGRIDHAFTTCPQLATFNVTSTAFLRFGPELKSHFLPTELILSDEAAWRLFGCFSHITWPEVAAKVIGNGEALRHEMVSYLVWCMKVELQSLWSQSASWLQVELVSKIQSSLSSHGTCVCRSAGYQIFWWWSDGKPWDFDVAKLGQECGDLWVPNRSNRRGLLEPPAIFLHWKCHF